METRRKKLIFAVNIRRDEKGKAVEPTDIKVIGDHEDIIKEIMHLFCWAAMNTAVDCYKTPEAQKECLKGIFEATKADMDGMYNQLEDKLSAFEDIIE